MPEPSTPSRIQAVVGPSWRLRDEAVTALVGGWTGPVRRSAEPDDLPGLLLGLDTPSLFEEPALTVVRAGAVWLRRHREALATAVAPATGGGAVLLSVAELDGRDAF